MNTENFDNEVRSLREEDSVLADAIEGLTARRKKKNEAADTPNADADEVKENSADESAPLSEITDSTDVASTGSGEAEPEATDGIQFGESYDESDGVSSDEKYGNTLSEDDADVITTDTEDSENSAFLSDEAMADSSDTENKDGDSTDSTETATADPDIEAEVRGGAEDNTDDAVQITINDVADADALAVSEDEGEDEVFYSDEDEEAEDDTDNSDQLSFAFGEETLFMASFDNDADYAQETTADNNAESPAPPVEEAVSGEADEPVEYIPSDEEEPIEEEKKETKPKKKVKDDIPKSRPIDTLFDLIELFIFSIAAVLLITTFLFRHSVVDGGSMERTLFEGEHLIISDLFYTPERGDIIVFEDYTTKLKKPVVKRIIALPGDTVEVTISGEVFVNDERLTEDYVYVDGLIRTSFPRQTVPEGEIFVMGDHRNNSTDSRDIGFIKIDSILGKVLFRFYPFDKFGKVD